MSLPITRNVPLSYDEQLKRADKRGVLAVAAFVLVILAVSFGSAAAQTVAHLVRSVTRSGVTAGSHITNVPLDAAFAAIIGVVVVAIGLAIRERRADEDREVFDVR